MLPVFIGHRSNKDGKQTQFTDSVTDLPQHGVPCRVFSSVSPARNFESMVVMVTCMFNNEKSVVMTFTVGQLLNSC